MFLVLTSPNHRPHLVNPAHIVRIVHVSDEDAIVPRAKCRVWLTDGDYLLVAETMEMIQHKLRFQDGNRLQPGD